MIQVLNLPATVYLNFLHEKTKINEKEAGVDPSLLKSFDGPSQRPQVSFLINPSGRNLTNSLAVFATVASGEEFLPRLKNALATKVGRFIKKISH